MVLKAAWRIPPIGFKSRRRKVGGKVVMSSFLTPVFIGRLKEVSQLDSVMADVRSGESRCVLVSGEAGIGKSRLVAEVRARAAAGGFTLLAGRCFEQDRSI